MSTSTATSSHATRSAAESVPTTWSAADEDFFRIAAELFRPTFLAGAGVLLGSYDDAA